VHNDTQRALVRKILNQEYSPVLTRGHYTLKDMSE